MLELEGERLTIQQWAVRKGVNATTIRYRLRQGMTVEDALNTPKWSLGRGYKRDRMTSARRISQVLKQKATESGEITN